jgi:SPP1 family phage portal protein
MLTEQEIRTLIENDEASEKKTYARIGERYYEAEHDIRDYLIFFYDAEGELKIDETKSNIKISHPFFTELVDQLVQYLLSNKEAFIKSDDPQLQKQLDIYFNKNDKFRAELSEIVRGSRAKGFEYAYAYLNAEGRIDFECADGLNVVQVRERDTDDGCAYVIYHYIERIDKNSKEIRRIQVWDDKQTWYYSQVDDGDITLDADKKMNPRPHTVFKKQGDEKLYYKGFGFIPFFCLRTCRKETSDLKPIKDLIDDYDLMNCGLSNNIQDAAEVLVVVRGHDGDDMDELMQNLKTKKTIGVPDPSGGVEYQTVDIPVEARKLKMEEDKKNIYRFGMGVDMEALKDSSATTNLAIEAAYSLLKLKAQKAEDRLKEFLGDLIKPVLAQINEREKTDYQRSDIYFELKHGAVTNEKEDADTDLVKAQKRQTEITTLLNIQSLLDNETLMQLICEQLDVDYEEIKSKLPKPEENDPYAPGAAQNILDGITPEDDDPEPAVM